MPREYSWEVRERAEELYIMDGLTFEQVSQATGVSLSQLKNWSAAGDWQECKQEYRQALSDSRRKMVLLRRDLINKALNSLEPQVVYAISSLEAAVARSLGREQATPAMPAAPPREINTTAEAIEALEEAIQRKLGQMLMKPEALSFAGLKDVQKTMELQRELKAQAIPEEAGKEEPERELSTAMLKKIKEQVYGLG